jgi:hypothetical protein
VWVLPRASHLAPPCTVARDTKTVSLANDIDLMMSEDIGSATATFVDDVTHVPVSLSVVGLRVRLPAALLQALVGCSPPTATVMITDAAQLGYVIQITVNNNNTATLRVL